MQVIHTIPLGLLPQPAQDTQHMALPLALPLLMDHLLQAMLNPQLPPMALPHPLMALPLPQLHRKFD